MTIKRGVAAAIAAITIPLTACSTTQPATGPTDAPQQTPAPASPTPQLNFRLGERGSVAGLSVQLEEVLSYTCDQLQARAQNYYPQCSEQPGMTGLYALRWAITNESAGAPVNSGLWTVWTTPDGSKIETEPDARYPQVGRVGQARPGETKDETELIPIVDGRDYSKVTVEVTPDGFIGSTIWFDGDLAGMAKVAPAATPTPTTAARATSSSKPTSAKTTSRATTKSTTSKPLCIEGDPEYNAKSGCPNSAPRSKRTTEQHPDMSYSSSGGTQRNLYG